MYSISRSIGGRLALRKLSNLRRGESFERARSGALGECAIASDGLLNLGAFGRRARIHPDRRHLAREHRLDLFREWTTRIETRERRGGAIVEIHAPVLLRR